MNKAVFLDRDGVLIEVVYRAGKSSPPWFAHEIQFMPGVFECLDLLRGAGYMLGVITNQPDVARGTDFQNRVEMVNKEVMKQLPLDFIQVCYHDTPDNCECRKPRPGMIFKAAEQYGIDLSASYTIGDRITDVVAGWRAGTRAMLVNDMFPLRDAVNAILILGGE